MSVFKNIVLGVVFLSRDKVHYGDNILTPPLLCLRWKCDQILKDKLLQFKRGWPQFKTGDYQTEAAK